VHSLGAQYLAKLAVRVRSKRAAIALEFDIFRWGTDSGCKMKCIAVIKKQRAKCRLAKVSRIFQHCLEYRLQLAGRRAYDLQYLRGRRLLLQRLAEIVSTLTQFVEQPCVLDGDDSLIGKSPQYRNLPVRERTGAERTTLSAPMASPPRIIGMIVIVR
jgi:hypothetical protein